MSQPLLTPPTLERVLTFAPAFDKRHAEPNKNYGIHGVEMRFVVRGPHGATQFVLYTNWQLPAVRAEFERRGCDFYCRNKPMPADLGYHSRTPRYEDQTSMGPCTELGGAPCYYDGSSLNAERIFDVLCAEGDAGVWRELEAFYAELFSTVEVR